MESLANAKNGEICTIKWLLGDSGTVDMMNSYNIKEGSTIRVIEQCMGDVIIGFGNVRLALCNKAADRIKI